MHSSFSLYPLSFSLSLSSSAVRFLFFIRPFRLLRTVRVSVSVRVCVRASVCACDIKASILCSTRTLNKALPPDRGLTNGDPGIEHFTLIPINAPPPQMNTRSTLNLTDTPINDLLTTCTKRTDESEPPTNHGPESVTTDLSSVKQEAPSAPIEDHLSSVPRSPPTRSDAEDILELQEVKHKRPELEKRFLQKIPIVKPIEDMDIQEFLSTAETILTQLKHSDETRLAQVREKLHESLYPWISTAQKKDNATPEELKRELPHQLHSQSSSSHPLPETKPCPISFSPPKDCDSKPSALDQLRGQVMPFSGDGDARQWFILFDSKLSESNLSLTDHLRFLPYFLTGAAKIWFSLSKHKMQCYTDFCQAFIIEYMQPNQTPERNALADRKNDPQPLQSSLLTNVSTSVLPLHSPNEEPPAILCHHVPSSRTTSIIPPNSVLSPAISKALIDKFVKDPIKFSGGKDDVTTWIEEVDQQFKTMHLNDLDKLNLVHICLKNDAHQWYRHNKDRFFSWQIFLDEIRKSFTSNLQRDLAFDKLKHYHQTAHQSISQYYTTLIKLMKQADPQMSESTKVQYLINGLRSSLSTETRRNYPKTTVEFLEQAKRAEEITAFNSNLMSNSSMADELQPSINSSSAKHLAASTVDHHNHQQSFSADHPDRNSPHSSTSDDQRRYINRISNPSSSASYDRNQPTADSFHPPHSNRVPRSNQRTAPSRFYSDSNRDQGQQQERNPNQHSPRCFRCGSPSHHVRQCNHFDQRSQ